MLVSINENIIKERNKDGSFQDIFDFLRELNYVK